MMRRSLRQPVTAWALAWALGVPATLSAQPNSGPTTAASSAAPPPAPSEPIVVTGRELSTKQAVRHLTRVISVEANDQLARFGDAACPSTAGLPPEYGQVVSERIRADAKAAGVTVAAPGCRPNIIVMFVDSGQNIVKQIRHDSPTAFYGVARSEIDHLEKDDGPVHAWTATEVRNEDGQPAQVHPTGGTPTLSVHTASMVNPSSQQAIVSAVVLFDNEATIGKTLNQLADYVAMRTLAQTSTRRTTASNDTILTLFAPGATPPPSLTSFDQAYLRSLYTGSGMRTYFSKIGTISSSINRTADARASSPPSAPASPH